MRVGRSRSIDMLVAVVAAVGGGVVADVASATEKGPSLTVPAESARSTPRRAKHDKRAIIDCNWHGAWRAPEGWAVAKVGSEVLTWNGGRTAVLVHVTAPQKDLALAREVAGRVAGTALTFGKPEVVRKSRWHSRTTLRGQGTLAGAPVEVLIEQHWRGFRKDLAWVQVAVGERRAEGMRAMDASRTSLLMLVSHACECGYDCDRRSGR